MVGAYRDGVARTQLVKLRDRKFTCVVVGLVRGEHDRFPCPPYGVRRLMVFRCDAIDGIHYQDQNVCILERCRGLHLDGAEQLFCGAQSGNRFGIQLIFSLDAARIDEDESAVQPMGVA